MASPGYVEPAVRLVHYETYISTQRVSLGLLLSPVFQKSFMHQPSLSLHVIGLWMLTSPMKPYVNWDQGTMVFIKSSPQPCDIQVITWLSRNLWNMLTWLIIPMNSPAFESNFAWSFVSPTTNSPLPVKKNMGIVQVYLFLHFLK